MDNFDIKKYLIENKVTRNSQVAEERGRPMFNYQIVPDKLERVKSYTAQDIANFAKDSKMKPINKEEANPGVIYTTLKNLKLMKQPINSDTFFKEYKLTTNPTYITTILAFLEKKGILVKA